LNPAFGSLQACCIVIHWTLNAVFVYPYHWKTIVLNFVKLLPVKCACSHEIWFSASFILNLSWTLWNPWSYILASAMSVDIAHYFFESGIQDGCLRFDLFTYTENQDGHIPEHVISYQKRILRNFIWDFCIVSVEIFPQILEKHWNILIHVSTDNIQLKRHC
jgi:hypothetical protein